MRIDPNISIEISALTEDKLILDRQADEDKGLFFKPKEDPNLTRIRSRLAYLGRLVEWYRGKVSEVLDLIGNQTVVIEEDSRFDFSPDLKHQRIAARQLAESILDSMISLFPTESIIGHWVGRLVKRDLLTPEAAAGLDLAAPQDTDHQERRRKAEKEEADYQAGFSRLQQAALSHGQRTGNGWALQDFLSVHNARIGGWPHDEKGLLEFSAALGQKSLLPGLTDRALSSIGELWDKVKV